MLEACYLSWTERYCSPTGAGAHDGTSEANAWTLAEAITNVNAGHRVNVKAGTYANTTTNRTFGTGAGAATTAAPKWWRGYKTAIGDQDARPTAARTAGTDFPLLTFTTGVPRVTDPHNWFSNIEFRGTAPGTHLFGITGSKCKFVRCRFDCQEAAATSYTVRFGSGSGDGQNFSECWFKGTTSVNNVVIAEERALFDGCSFHGGGNGAMADLSAGGPVCFLDCIFDDNGDDSVEIVGHASHLCILDSCLFYSPGGHGINVTSTAPMLLLVRNCLFHTITTASKYGINLPAGSAIPLVQNAAWYNVTTKFNNLTEDAEWNAVAESNDPLVDGANDDFDLDTADAASDNAGAPGLFENLDSTRSYADVGPVRHVDPAGGGGTTIAGTPMRRGMV
jgi:hypothetical protein